MIMLAKDDLSIEGATPETMVAVHDFVRRGMPLNTVVRGFQLGHASVLRSFQHECAALLDGPQAAAEMAGVTDRLLTFFDVFVIAMSSEYAAEHERWVAGGGATRGEIVRAILDDAPFDRRAAEFTLGYDLSRSHIGCIVDSEYEAHDDPTELSRLTSQMLLRLGCVGGLTLAVSTRRLWAWGALPRATVDLGRLGGEAPGPGLRVSFGRPDDDLDGFRRSHHQAVLAARTVRDAHLPLVSFADVDLACLLGVDAQLAADFVSRELGELAGDDASLVELRRTLRVYLDERRSVARAAEGLAVARNTVSYRVRKAEALRGRPITERQLELHAALRLVALS
jgi:DNA-binding PucR family transcriptional regulator